MCALGDSLYVFSSNEIIEKAENASILSLMKWREINCYGQKRFLQAGITTVAENKILIFGSCTELSEIKFYDDEEFFPKLYVYEFNTDTEKLEKRKELGIIKHKSMFTAPGN